MIPYGNKKAQMIENLAWTNESVQGNITQDWCRPRLLNITFQRQEGGWHDKTKEIIPKKINK